MEGEGIGSKDGRGGVHKTSCEGFLPDPTERTTIR